MKDSQYIVTTGWNRRISMFIDDIETFKLHPVQILPDENSEPWHSDDVLAMSFCPPFILATSSYDGEIILCNLQSGHIIHRLRAPIRDLNKCRSVDKILFLNERLNNKSAVSMVTCGADGILRFWNIEEGFLMSEVDGNLGRGEGIYSMCTNSSNSILITGDSRGFVTIWSIIDMCINDTSKDDISIIISWRCHVKTIVSVEIVESHDMVVTSSIDCAVRLFTLVSISTQMKGEFVGTFGQDDFWDINQPETFQHPSIPFDVELKDMEDSNDKESSDRTKKGKQLITKMRRTGEIIEIQQLDSETLTDFERYSIRSRTPGNLVDGNSNFVSKSDVGDQTRCGSIFGEAQRFTEIKESQLGLERRMSVVRTADLLKKDYRTKFATSIYAQERQISLPKRPRQPFLREKTSPSKGIYHSLKPQELCAIDSPTSFSAKRLLPE
ncbi:WD40 repeat domain 95, partial [Nowakowskiella sp. JEL0078]